MTTNKYAISRLENKAQQLGAIYHLIEQFELISRTDLAKLSGFAPASITALSKTLIEHKLVIERTAQNSTFRGRPAVGLSVSPFFWQQLCITIFPEKIDISLCELNGKLICKRIFSISPVEYPRLVTLLTDYIKLFYQTHQIDNASLIAISISVIGRIDSHKKTITQLANTPLQCNIIETLQPLFQQPVLLNEHFQLWLLAESAVGSLINNDNVIFLHLDDDIHLSVLLKGAPIQHTKHKRMNVDKMCMPRFSELCEQTAPELDNIQRYQLCNQVTFSKVARLVDQLLPNQFTTTSDKIIHLCEQIEQNNPDAINILHHIADNLAYVLMNLINIFSSEKIMINSPLLRVKTPLFARIQYKLKHKLLLDNLHIDLVTSQYDWDSTFIPSAAIKKYIYNGDLIKNMI